MSSPCNHFSANCIRRHGGYGAKRRILTTVRILPFILTLPILAGAQSASAQEAQTAQVAIEQITVTGSRIVRDGFEAPTPISVLSEAELLRGAGANIADIINELPSLAGSVVPQGSRGVSNGGAGMNNLNLRSLDEKRTLVLLDGQRFVGAQPTQVVDINQLPQGLVSRVDIVTGGASAVYGSDALAGVVNFVLDRDFTGLKGEVSGGITTYGDNENMKVTLTGGVPFANGRGHVLLNGEVSHIAGLRSAPRAWANQGWQTMSNPKYTPTNGEPNLLVLPRVSQTQQTRGGIITAGPLAGIAFGPGGKPYPFAYGPVRFDPWMQGGEWRANDVAGETYSLDNQESRQTTFFRVSYDLTENVEAYIQSIWGHTHTTNLCCSHFNQGNITVQGDNAFIPAEISARITALGLTTIRMGSYNFDLPELISTNNDRHVFSNMVGVEGDVDFFDTAWDWNVYYTRGKSRTSRRFTDRISKNYKRAIDAVFDPQTGNIVCRSTLLGEAGSENCIPFNLFGEGVNSEAAVNYSAGTAYNYANFTQSVFAATVTGEPFSSWAGPVSVALGMEHRKEGGGGIQDRISKGNGYLVGNIRPTEGSYTVTEGFLETLVPLIDGTALGESLDVNAAIRFTDYSTSGYVTTWKVGATYTPVSDITIRASRSRDIRAPNREELFAAGRFAGATIFDPFTSRVITYQREIGGNRDLTPEKANTTGVGVVLQPSWMPGFSGSVDYYSIDVADAIGTLRGQGVIDRCFAGQKVFCDSIVQEPGGGRSGISEGVTPAGIELFIAQQPVNFVSEKARGIDIETSYQFPLDDLVPNWGGEVALRVLATHFIKMSRDDGVNTPTDRAGEATRDGPPNWKYMASATYTNDPWSVTLTGRGISAGVLKNTHIECTSGCPTSTSLAKTINKNSVAGAFWIDASFNYEFLGGDDGDTTMEMFFNVQNLLDKDPPVVTSENSSGTVSFSTYPANPRFYDTLGRMFRLGVRFSH